MRIKDRIAETMKNDGAIGFSFTFFLRSMAAVLAMDSAARLGDENMARKIAGVLANENILYGATQHIQCCEFMKWFLNQEEPISDDGMLIWNEFEFISDKWNEFAREEERKWL